mmetsp:Transcript_23740/g.46640  ORF Transcript_23740/g.46640 Transcript_23740/m.46640 type:complete len:106 (-) Transcript_23740:113-430(-)
MAFQAQVVQGTNPFTLSRPSAHLSYNWKPDSVQSQIFRKKRPCSPELMLVELSSCFPIKDKRSETTTRLEIVVLSKLSERATTDRMLLLIMIKLDMTSRHPFGSG